MKQNRRPLAIRTSPHFHGTQQTDQIMLHVTYALLPVSAMAIFYYGLSALLVITVSIVSSMLTEHLLNRATGKYNSLSDNSALLTGLLLGLTLPPSLPLWMAFLGGVVSIGIGKYLFGGLGANIFNPALLGRAFLMSAFPVALTTWYPSQGGDRFTSLLPGNLALPFTQPLFDGVTTATPLSLMKFENKASEIISLFVGNTTGSLGETSAVLILLGGAYLAWKKMLNWRIPVGIFLSVFLFSSLLHLSNTSRFPSPDFMLFSGGLMLGAVFMATDMVTSPVTPRGVWIYSILIGILTVVIRTWGGLPEGVMYSILLGNALSPLIDSISQPRVYGTRTESAAKK